jgi:hypothetical protein
MNTLLFTRVFFFGTVALSFPLAAVAVFGFGTDRHVTADVLSVIYGFGIAIGLTTSYWPLPCLREWDRPRRLESLVLMFLGMSYFTHLTWELGWLLLHDVIAVSPDAPWAYAWWAYIDGGDARYANPSSTLLGMEILSVCNGLVGATALVQYLKSGRTHRAAVLVMAATAVVHLYSASLYYLTELLEGLPNVNTESFVGLWIKFFFANLPWVVVPWCVLAWARGKLAQAGATR